MFSFKSLKSFGGSQMGNRNKSKMSNFEWLFFLTIVQYKFSLILISCTSANPNVTNNQISFVTSSRQSSLKFGIIKFSH